MPGRQWGRPGAGGNECRTARVRCPQETTSAANAGETTRLLIAWSGVRVPLVLAQAGAVAQLVRAGPPRGGMFPHFRRSRRRPFQDQVSVTGVGYECRRNYTFQRSRSRVRVPSAPSPRGGSSVGRAGKNVPSISSCAAPIQCDTLLAGAVNAGGTTRITGFESRRRRRKPESTFRRSRHRFFLMSLFRPGGECRWNYMVEPLAGRPGSNPGADAATHPFRSANFVTATFSNLRESSHEPDQLRRHP